MLLFPCVFGLLEINVLNAENFFKSSACNTFFNSDFTKQGTFTSPNYPIPYPNHTRCQYEFQGREPEKIQVIFTDFHLGLQEPFDCENSGFLDIYTMMENQKKKIDSLCGSAIPKPIMSNGPKLFLEFYGKNPLNFRGFSAIYKFTKNYSLTTGKQLPGKPCAFDFNSNDARNGTFQSPNFPGIYPHNTECHYYFNGRPNERVYINFIYFDVEGVSPCETNSASDYVEFSNFMATDRKYNRHCGKLKNFLVKSDRKFFRVTFRANDRLDGTGFQAVYQFKDESDLNPHILPPQRPPSVNNGASTINFGFYIIPTIYLIFLSMNVTLIRIMTRLEQLA